MKKYMIAILFFGLGLGVGYCARRLFYPSAEPRGEMDFATFKGGVVKEAEILDSLRSDLEAQKQSVYELKKAATIQRVKRKLLEIEAEKQNVTPEQLLAGVGPQGLNVSDDQVRAFLANQGMDYKKATPLQIENAKKIIHGTKMLTESNKVIDDLYEKADVQILIEQ